jgi:hypothetical protein
LFNEEEQRKLVQTYWQSVFLYEDYEFKSVKADSIATVELSQVRVEMQLPKSQNDIVQTTETHRKTAF